MTKEELQKMIDQEEQNTGEMIRIAKAYIQGEVLRDLVAAESWLMKAIEQEDEESLKAMLILGKEVLGIEKVISDQDYQNMEEELRNVLENAQDD